ncbi:MAG: hypothetical protein D6703_05840 [Zetaproteobacteria bacterium]|nr:MAG: hypothetical protein D6703_05840 [Zetaproteobacteria bacterium]
MALLAMSMLLVSCATPENHYDPIEPVNRFTDGVNDAVDRVALKPVTQAYRDLTPDVLKRGISNFYDNWSYLNTVLNDFLQGKGKQGFEDFGRFLVNSTIGLGGLVDVASGMGLEKHEEDFGQTLAVWGVGRGAYLIYPVFGPNSVRKTPDFLTSTLTDGLFWLSFVISPQATLALTALKFIDLRSRAMSATNMRDELALDPYVFTREAWFQHRDYLIHDGKIPKKSQEDDWEEDDWGDEDWQGKGAADPIPPYRAETMRSEARSGLRSYHVNLSSHAIRREAEDMRRRLEEKGIHAEVAGVDVGGRHWFRVRLPELFSPQVARRKAEAMRELLPDLQGAWASPASGSGG